MFLVEADYLIDFMSRSEEHRAPLMDAFRLNFKDASFSSGGKAASILHDESHGVALI